MVCWGRGRHLRGDRERMVANFFLHLFFFFHHRCNLQYRLAVLFYLQLRKGIILFIYYYTSQKLLSNTSQEADISMVYGRNNVGELSVAYCFKMWIKV